jgi:hypothetical protein
MTYNRDFTDAPKEESLLGVVPTGDPEGPLMIVMMWWDVDLGRWEGDWRHLADEAGEAMVFAKNDPIAWCLLPDIDEELMNEYTSAAAPASLA